MRDRVNSPMDATGISYALVITWTTDIDPALGLTLEPMTFSGPLSRLPSSSVWLHSREHAPLHFSIIPASPQLHFSSFPPLHHHMFFLCILAAASSSLLPQSMQSLPQFTNLTLFMHYFKKMFYALYFHSLISSRSFVSTQAPNSINLPLNKVFLYTIWVYYNFVSLIEKYLSFLLHGTSLHMYVLFRWHVFTNTLPYTR